MKKMIVILAIVLGCSGCFNKTVEPMKNCMNTTYMFVVKTSLVVVETNRDQVVGIQQFNIKDAVAGPAAPTGRKFNFISLDDNKTIDKIEIIKSETDKKEILIGDKISFKDFTEIMYPYVLINKKE